MSTIVTVSATIDGVDDETFGDNEHGHKESTLETVLGNAQPQNVMHMELRWGGECRVELELTGQMLANNDVRIEGVAIFFEGDSEDTGDEDDRSEFTFLVPQGMNISNRQRLTNPGAGDSADIRMTVNNSVIGKVTQPLTVAAQGVIYAIMPNDDLMWFRHDGRNDGTFSWAFGGTGKKVGNGWDVKHVFSGGDGVIYYIDGQNRLLWNRHEGHGDGSFRWGPTNREVGTGWDVKHVFSE